MKLNIYITDAKRYLAGSRSFHATKENVSIDTWFLAGTVEFTPSVDNKELISSVIDNLKSEETQLRAEFQLRLDSIEESRQRILAIPHMGKK